MTGRGRILVLLGLAGQAFGILGHQHHLAWLSLTMLIWLTAEWMLFNYRLWVELPRIKSVRRVNGRDQGNVFLWSGRKIEVEVDIDFTNKIHPVIGLRDCLPENVQITEGSNEVAVLSKTQQQKLKYSGRVRGAGRLTLPGIRVVLTDAQGFFRAHRFLECSQTFRVLPAFRNVGDIQPVVKRVNSIPLHGIHRLQRSGMGSELLELREYVPGDPPKSIAWKVSARRESLMTRQYESEVPVRVRLFVDGSISTRIGGYGCRLIDQMVFVAASVAKSAVSVGDPVSAVLFDERGHRRVPAGGGDKGFYRLLESLSDFADNPSPPRQKLTTNLMSATNRLCEERYPELLEPRVNQVPFTFFPLGPLKRRNLYQRTLIASVIATKYGLGPDQIVRLTRDDGYMAQHCQTLLADHGVAWIDPLVGSRDRGFHDGIATMELLSKALSESVAVAKDNEVFVIMANLLECATNISNLLPAIKMARARHHRVVVIVPTPAFQRPNEIGDATPDLSNASAMLEHAEELRTIELRDRLQQSLHRIGARVSLSGDEQAIHMILAETELTRSGRASRAGASS